MQSKAQRQSDTICATSCIAWVSPAKLSCSSLQNTQSDKLFLEKWNCNNDLQVLIQCRHETSILPTALISIRPHTAATAYWQSAEKHAVSARGFAFGPPCSPLDTEGTKLCVFGLPLKVDFEATAYLPRMSKKRCKSNKNLLRRAAQNLHNIMHMVEGMVWAYQFKEPVPGSVVFRAMA